MNKIIYTLAIFLTVCSLSAQSVSNKALYGGLLIGATNIDSHSPGIGIEIGKTFALKSKWGLDMNLFSCFSENQGGFSNPDHLPYVVNNALGSNPLLTLQNPDLGGYPGIKLHTTFNRLAIWSLGLSAQYQIWKSRKSGLFMNLGAVGQVVDLAYTDYFLVGSYYVEQITGTDKAIFPVFRYQSYVDVGPVLGFSFRKSIGSKCWAGVRLTESYYPSSQRHLVTAGLQFGTIL